MDIMKTSGIKKKVIEEIRQLAADYNVQKVILFGSRARGDYRERSDIDLAVSGGDTNNFALTVDEETSTLLMYDIVDLSLPVQQELKNRIYQEVWLEALVSGNNVAHAYNQAIAMDIIKKTKEQYVVMFRELRSEIKENWI